MQVLQLLGAGTPTAQAQTAGGVLTLVAGLVQACGVSSQPGKLPQVLAKACGCLPPDLSHSCLAALLQCNPGGAAAAASWLVDGDAAAAVDLLLQYARHKGLGSRWAQWLATAASSGAAHLLAGLAAAALSLQGRGSAAIPGAALRAAVTHVEQMTAASATSAGSKLKQQSAWELQVAAVLLEHLQQAAVAAAASGAVTGVCPV